MHKSKSTNAPRKRIVIPQGESTHVRAVGLAWRRAEVHAAFGTQPKDVRVVAMNVEIDALRRLPLECDSIFPEMKKRTLLWEYGRVLQREERRRK